MTYELVPHEEATGAIVETSEYRRTHYRVYDANGFASTFETGPPELTTLSSVLACVTARFHGTGGTGYDSKDLVVMLADRIVAVVRQGRNGEPEVTTFET